MDAFPAISPLASLSPDSSEESFLKNREQDAHQQLEAVFISMLVKELRTAGLEEGLFAGDSSDTFGGMFDSFMGEELAKSGGIGLQRLFKDPVIPSAAQISEIRRQAKEAYGNAEATSIKPTGGS